MHYAVMAASRSGRHHAAGATTERSHGRLSEAPAGQRRPHGGPAVACEDGRVTTELVAEAIKKAGIAWINVAGGPPLALWVMPLDGSLIVVCGPGEQAAPGLADASRASVRLRGDNGALIVIVEAVVERLVPGSDAWAEIAPQLAGKRLNASGTAEELVARWAETDCAVLRLTPADEPPVAGPDLPSTSGAAPPRETPARITVRRPFRLHRVRKRKP
jgi:hypothetical protein